MAAGKAEDVVVVVFVVETIEEEVEKASVGEVVDGEGVEDGEVGTGVTTTTTLDEVLAEVGVCEVLGLLNGEAVTVGLTKTVAVETMAPKRFLISYVESYSGEESIIQPTPSHSYPGMQQPPPELPGQLLYPSWQVDTC